MTQPALPHPLPRSADPGVEHSPLLQCYAAIEQVSQSMVQAAHRGDWDQVVQLEASCALLISHLKQTARTQPLRKTEQRRKAGIMQRILLNDAQIRALAEPELDALGQLMAWQPQSLLH